jgi:hypothetical protein
MPFTILQLVCGLLGPAVVVLLAGALACRFCSDASWVFGPAIAAGFALAYWNFEPAPAWPPTANVVYLLFYLALVGGVLVYADAMLKPPTWLRALAFALLWRIAARLFLQRQVPVSMSESELAGWIDVWTIVTTGWWLAFETMAERWPGVSVPLLLGMLSIAGAIFLTMGWHIQGSGAMAGAVAGMCVPGVVLGVISRRVLFARGFAAMIVLLLQLLLVHGYFYTDDTLTNRQELLFGILLGSPLLAFIVEIPLIRRQRPLWQLLGRIVFVGIVLATICTITLRDYIKTEQAAAMQDE